MKFTDKSILQKPNDAIVMMPRTGKLTPGARKVYNVLLHRTQTEVIVFKERGKVVDAEHLFEAPLREVFNQSISADNKSDNIAAVKGYFREMRRIEVDWEAPDAKTGVVWRSLGLLSEAQLEKRNGVLWARWALPPTLLAAVSDPQLFTLLNLEEIGKLDKYASIALYEICARYRTNPRHTTSCNSIEWWTDALSSTPVSIDARTGLRNRREWRNFKREFVVPAIEEINSKTDLNIELLEFKEVRMVKEAQFKVTGKPKLTSSLLPKVAIELAELAAQCDISIDSIARLMRDGDEEGIIKTALLRLASRVKDPDLEPIVNRLAYLKKTILDLAGKTKPNIGMSAVMQPVAQKKEQLVIVKSPEETRRDEIRTQFRALPLDERSRFAALAFAELKEKGLASAVISRKFQSGEWDSAALFNYALQSYVVETFGPDGW